KRVHLVEALERVLANKFAANGAVLNNSPPCACSNSGCRCPKCGCGGPCRGACSTRAGWGEGVLDRGALRGGGATNGPASQRPARPPKPGQIGTPGRESPSGGGCTMSRRTAHDDYEDDDLYKEASPARRRRRKKRGGGGLPTPVVVLALAVPLAVGVGLLGYWWLALRPKEQLHRN